MSKHAAVRLLRELKLASPAPHPLTALELRAAYALDGQFPCTCSTNSTSVNFLVHVPPTPHPPSTVSPRYLKRALKIHPDRAVSPAEKARFHASFIELHEAWSTYARTRPQLSRNNSRPTASAVNIGFEPMHIGFGVGCARTPLISEHNARRAVLDDCSLNFAPSIQQVPLLSGPCRLASPLRSAPVVRFPQVFLLRLA